MIRGSCFDRVHCDRQSEPPRFIDRKSLAWPEPPPAVARARFVLSEAEENLQQLIDSVEVAQIGDAAQAAAAAPFLCTSALIPGCAGIANVLNANNRIGLTALRSNTQGSNETFSGADFSE